MVLGSGLALGFAVIMGETEQPGYHGIRWQKCNPKLREWWGGKNPQ